MTTILDCIQRIPEICEKILDSYPAFLAPVTEGLGEELGRIDELVFVGSGTSDTSARTSQPIVGKVSGLRTTVLWPSELERISSYGMNPRGLYIFTSQTGTSKLTAAMMAKVQEAGCHAMSITESEGTPMAKASRIHVVMGCGQEEFLMRTIGYVSSALVHCLLGLQIGLRRGYLSQEEHDAYLAKARGAAQNRRLVTEQIKTRFPEIRDQLKRAQEVIFTGNGSLYGVSLEGAVKFWEMPQKPCIGLELEEGLHGPNFGYGEHQCVIYLADGMEPDKAKGLSLVRYMKAVFGMGIAIGDVPEELGIALPVKGGEFSFIEMSAVVQVLAYELTRAIGRDVSRPIDHSVMNSYFTTHG